MVDFMGGILVMDKSREIKGRGDWCGCPVFERKICFENHVGAGLASALFLNGKFVLKTM
jgi:hypothetical protein